MLSVLAIERLKIWLAEDGKGTERGKLEEGQGNNISESLKARDTHKSWCCKNSELTTECLMARPLLP